METTVESFERITREKKCKKKHYPFTRFFSARFAIGIFILMNPIVSILDVFPDFIGYILIFSAIDELKRINDGIATAAFRMKYLIGIGIVKFICSFAVFNFDNSWILTLATFFGVVELFFMILFFNSFFEGMTYLQERHGDGEKFISCSEVKFISIFFMGVKTLTTVFPQLWALFETDAKTELAASRALDSVIRMKTFAIILSVVVCLIFGIVWMARFLRYLKGIRSNEVLIGNLRTKFTEEILDRSALYTNKTVSAALALISVGHLFLYDFTLERVHVMPEAISLILIMCGMAMLSSFVNVKKLTSLFFVSLSLNVISYVYRALFVDETVESASLVNVDRIMVSAGVYLLFALSLLVFFRAVQTSLSMLSTEFFDESIDRLFAVPNMFLIGAVAMTGGCYICPPYKYIFVTMRIIALSVWAYKNIKIFNTFSGLIKEDY
ncbi:MAG: hypothetical protein IJS94_02865 [Clostridia bacterium]|nr:hypothetical protein [Clostridia bacterium]